MTITCEHGRQRSRCKDCGGGGICKHGKTRTACKQCGGSSICVHGRHKCNCKECGGANICVHGRRRCLCKDCGGSSICPHSRERRLCRECGGASICPHGRQKNLCKECGGVSICQHSRVRSQCRECKGASICSHGRPRHQCRECKGASICSHGKARHQCRDCLATIEQRLADGSADATTISGSVGGSTTRSTTNDGSMLQTVFALGPLVSHSQHNQHQLMNRNQHAEARAFAAESRRVEKLQLQAQANRREERAGWLQFQALVHQETTLQASQPRDVRSEQLMHIHIAASAVSDPVESERPSTPVVEGVWTWSVLPTVEYSPWLAQRASNHATP